MSARRNRILHECGGTSVLSLIAKSAKSAYHVLLLLAIGYSGLIGVLFLAYFLLVVAKVPILARFAIVAFSAILWLYLWREIALILRRRLSSSIISVDEELDRS